MTATRGSALTKCSKAAVFAGALAVGMFGAGAANAVLMVQVESGGVTQTFADNVLGQDSSAAIGRLSTSTTIGNFSFVFALATSKPIIGSVTQPRLDLTFNALSDGGGGTLIVRFTDTDFALGTSTNAVCDIGGRTDGSVSYSCFYDAGNAPFGTATNIANLGPFSGGAFSGSEGGTVNPATPISFTDVLTITHGAGDGKLSTGNANVRVPEPGSLGLFGLGLLGLGLLWRRRSRLGRAA